jgi:hypothetical protein
MNDPRMDWMYGEVGHYKRQMMQWARLNDCFNDTMIDERFFDPEVEGPEGMGNPAAALEGAGRRSRTPATGRPSSGRWAARRVPFIDDTILTRFLAET